MCIRPVPLVVTWVLLFAPLISRAAGVAQLANCAENWRSAEDFLAWLVADRGPASPSCVCGVGHAVNATACRSPPPLSVRPRACFRSPLSAPPVGVLGVGQLAN
jgi:hypothetical protein